jgi:hypothetical protein
MAACISSIHVSLGSPLFLMRLSEQNYADALKRSAMLMLPVSFLSDLVPYFTLAAAESASEAVALYV